MYSPPLCFTTSSGHQRHPLFTVPHVFDPPRTLRHLTLVPRTEVLTAARPSSYLPSHCQGLNRCISRCCHTHGEGGWGYLAHHHAHILSQAAGKKQACNPTTERGGSSWSTGTDSVATSQTGRVPCRGESAYHHLKLPRGGLQIGIDNSQNRPGCASARHLPAATPAHAPL